MSIPTYLIDKLILGRASLFCECVVYGVWRGTNWFTKPNFRSDLKTYKKKKKFLAKRSLFFFPFAETGQIHFQICDKTIFLQFVLKGSHIYINLVKSILNFRNKSFEIHTFCMCLPLFKTLGHGSYWSQKFVRFLFMSIVLRVCLQINCRPIYFAKSVKDNIFKKQFLCLQLFFFGWYIRYHQKKSNPFPQKNHNKMKNILFAHC